MQYYEVALHKIVRRGTDVLTYHSERSLKTGQLISIPVGSKAMLGIVTRQVARPKFATKPIDSIYEELILPEQLVQTALWMADYYATPLASVVQTILPRGVLKKRRVSSSPPHIATRKRTNIVLNNFQRLALEKLRAAGSTSVILHGVTGSGKTQVYIELAKETLAAGKSVIILVPEIALTSQTIDEFSHHFSNILLTHSQQTEAQRHRIWQEALEATQPRLVIGPRSALFMPLKNIGLIVIDESHEPSFKQEQSPRYSALRSASVLGSLHGSLVVYGSATPLITDYYLAVETKKPIITLPERARKDTIAPTISLVDMKKKTEFKKHRFLSNRLLSELEQTAPHARQALIFHNRRGTASTTLCENCGWIATDPQTFIPLTLHADSYELRSHLTGYHIRVPKVCPVCGHADIIHKGIGTKLIESELRRLFPDKSIIRFDGDNTSSETLASQYKKIYDGDFEIIIGTQVVAKGLDLPLLRSVAVIQADAGLGLPDYGASERTFQLLAQVIGRVGRTEHESTIVVQSYQPEHPAVVYGINQDYDGFYHYALAERKRAGFPPFSYLLRLTCLYKSEAAAIAAARALASELKTKIHPDISILGPAPAFYEYQAGSYRWQLTLKSPVRGHLRDAVKFIPATHWQYELDPSGLG